MKVKSPVLPKWGENVLVSVFVITGAPALLAIAALVALWWLKRRAIGPRNVWQHWFAWYPVKVGFDDVRWLEMVERRSMGIMCDTHHRSLDAEAPVT